MLKVLLSVGALQLAAMLVMMVRTKGLALLLGPEQFGLMAALDRLVAVFAQTASLSMPFAALRYLSPLWHTDPPGYYDLLRRMRNVLLALVGAALVVGVGLAWTRPDVLGAEVARDRFLATLALATLPVVALVPFLQNTVASSFAHNRAMRFALLHAAVITVASLLGVWFWGLPGLYACYAVLGGVLVTTVLIRVARRPSADVRTAEAPTIASDSGQPHRPDPPEPTEAGGKVGRPFWRRVWGYLPHLVWRFCLLLLPPAFLAPAVAYAVFYLVLSQRGDEAAGFMQAAIGISIAMRGVLGAANQVFLTPLVNRSGAFTDRLERANQFLHTLLLLVGIVVPPLVLLSDVAVRVLYSPAFLPGAPFVAAFVIAEVLTLTVGAYQAVLIAMEHIVFHVTQNAVAQLAMYGVALATIPTLGIAGAAGATITAQAVLFVGTLSYLRYRHRLRLPPRLVALSLYVLAVLSVGGVLAAQMPGLALDTLAWKAGYYFAATAALAVFLNREDWANLRRFARGGRDAPHG